MRPKIGWVCGTAVGRGTRTRRVFDGRSEAPQARLLSFRARSARRDNKTRARIPHQRARPCDLSWCSIPGIRVALQLRLHRPRSTAPSRSPRLGITFHPVDIDNSGIMSIDNGGAPGERRNHVACSSSHPEDPPLRRLHRGTDRVECGQENVSLLERVREAIDDHATIAVSLRYSGGTPFA